MRFLVIGLIVVAATQSCGMETRTRLGGIEMSEQGPGVTAVAIAARPADGEGCTRGIASVCSSCQCSDDTIATPCGNVPPEHVAGVFCAIEVIRCIVCGG